jgi:DNA polymerase I-like protein with 3'-5' exonuclease and polymerase domains
LRQWAWRPIVVADLMKGAREGLFPEIRRPARRVLVSPTLSEVKAWTAETLASPPPFLAPDIETASGQITCIGFARSRGEALVVPFWNRTAPGWSYWPTFQEELEAFQCVKALLESPIPKVWQNGVYDLQYLMKYGVRPARNAEDTMLRHHSQFPELQKGLGFLGSIYTDEASWKLMRRRKADTEKKDE